MNKNAINNNIFTKFLPEDLDSKLVGLLLSDGGIYRTSKTSNCRYEMSFGTKYKQFAESIGQLFKEYMKNPVKEVQVKGVNKVYKNYRLKTMTLPIFNIYHDIFYVYNTVTNKYVKIVPDLILDFINPIVLAYLIMGDGNYDTILTP